MSGEDQTTRNEAAVRRYVEEVLNKRNPALIDEFFATSCEFHALWYQSGVASWPAGGSVVETMKGHLARPDPNYENVHTAIDQLFGIDDRIVMVSTTTGTRCAKLISQTEIEIYRFTDGKIVEVWWLTDRLGVFQQLGVIPPTRDLVRYAGLQAT